MATINVTVGMTPEMLDQIDEMAEKLDVSRARAIRVCLRQANASPLAFREQDRHTLEVDDSDAEEAQRGAA